jgi:hypothetical protein
MIHREFKRDEIDYIFRKSSHFGRIGAVLITKSWLLLASSVRTQEACTWRG